MPSKEQPAKNNLSKQAHPKKQNTDQSEISAPDWDTLLIVIIPILIGILIAVVGFLLSSYPSVSLWAAFAAFSLLNFILYYIVRRHVWRGDNDRKFIKRFCLVSQVVVLAGALIWQYYLFRPAPIETEFEGVLAPADDPNPPSRCPEPEPGYITIYHGDGASSTKDMRQGVVEFGGDSVLSIEREADGISVSAKIFSEDSRVIAEIIKNKFYINPSNYFRRERPDKHTLIVYDQKARRVLYVRFLNPTAVKVMGIFNYPNRLPVFIGENEIRFQGGMHMTGMCSHVTQSAISLP